VKRLVLALVVLAMELPVLYVLIAHPEFFVKLFGLR
jgi:hypothetical protein